jgi:putative protease
MPPPKLPELLSPAGNWDCARAAVENGADAIYFGLESFNARMRADNFTAADLPKLMEFLHRRGVRGYACFNTLIFSNELSEAEAQVRAMIAADVDAAIVQDVGICRLIREISSDFPMHASTQMTVTSLAGVQFVRELGCSLVVLSRECSMDEIRRIITSQPAGLEIPIEIFIHGALCVAYSGQCLTSEALGGRSANRGVCAQACRMPYDLIADGKPVPLGDRRYLLSPQDLVGLELLPEVIRAGVASLKIEGRLKTPEYVANITRIYREALDKAAAMPMSPPVPVPGSPSRHDPGNGSLLRLDSSPYRYDMEMAFSRGLYTGWLRGINNQQLVHGRFGTKRGVFLGTVSRVESDRVAIKLEGPLKPGDGVVFDASHPDVEEEGGRVYQILPVRSISSSSSPASRRHERQHPPGNPHPIGSLVYLAFGRGDIDFSRVHAGDKLWKTNDPELDRRLRQSFAGDQPRFQRPINLRIAGACGSPMRVDATDADGRQARAESTVALSLADKQPLTTERLREQFGRLGGTPFRLGHLDNQLEANVILPVSELNRLRRDLVSQLKALRIDAVRWTIRPESPLEKPRSANGAHAVTYSKPVQAAPASDPPPASSIPSSQANLIVLARNLPQLEAALRCGIQTLYCDFEDPKRYREAVRLVRQSVNCQAAQPTVWVAPPRICKASEDWILKQVRSCDPDGYLVRNYDHLQYFTQAGDRRIGDYSLNIANEWAAEYFLARFGLERLTASYDLNLVQLEALLCAAPPEWFEVTIHQHMPMFHMEHCVFCAFLSSGTDYTNCGRPCDRVELKLRDRIGAEHPVKADAGCRNTVFNALAQTGAEFVSQLLGLGVRHFRLEFVNETPDQVERAIGRYRQLLRGEITGGQLWRELKLHNQLGVTRGQLLNPDRRTPR